MRFSSSLRCWFLLSLLWCGHGWADTVISLRSAQWPGMAIQGLQARLGDDADRRIHLSLRVAQLSVERLGWHRVGLQVDGRLARDPGGRWRFEGRLDCRGAPGGAWSHAQLMLLVDRLANSLFVHLQQDQSALAAAMPLDQPSHWQISLDQMPASWLHPGVDDGRESQFSRGLLSGKLALDLHDDGLHESGLFEGRDIALLMPGIGFDGSGLNGTAQLNARTDAAGHLVQARVQAQLQGGRWNYQGWQADLGGAAAVHMALQADPGAHGGMDVAMHWADPEALHFDARWQLDPRGHVRDLAVQHLWVGLAPAYQHYAASLQARPWSEWPWLVSGQVGGSLAWKPAGWQAVDLHMREVSLQLADTSWKIEGLQGSLDWRAHGTGPVTSVAWRQLSLGQAIQPAGQLQWQSRDGQERLQTPWRLALWDGQVQLSSLWFAPQSGGLQWATMAGLQHVHLEAPLRALSGAGLPLVLDQAPLPMHGNLQQASVDARVQAELWGGRISASGLHLQRTGRREPLTLAADLQFDHLDLQPFGSYADIGTLAGRVSGRVDGLQWRDGAGAQSFRLSLRSDGPGHLNARSIGILAGLTGSTATSGVQGMMLRMFHAPAYARLGLDARLADGRLFLDGLEHDARGYTLVEGRGLPFLRLSGRDSSMPWPVALRRLHAAASLRSPGH